MSDEDADTPGPKTPLADGPAPSSDAPTPAEAPAPAPLPKPYPGIVQAVVLVVVLLLLQVGIGLGFFFGARYFGPDAAFNDGVVLGAGIGLSFTIILAWGVRRGRVGIARALPLGRVPGAIYPALSLAIVGLGIVNTELINLVNVVLPMPDFVTGIFEKLAGGGAAAIITIVVIGPVMEELLFRGIILRGFLARYKPVTAIIVSSLLFGLLHLNPYQFVAAMILGVIFAWLVLRTGSLWPSVFGHVLYNGYLVVAYPRLLGTIQPGYDPQAMAFQPLWLDLTGLGLVGVGLFALTRVIRRGPARS